MDASWSLRNRVAITLALFGGAVSLALAIIIYLASHDLEARLIDDTLTAELDDYVARRHRNPLSLPERTATIRAYVVSDQDESRPIPDVVRQLRPGRHSIVLDGVGYRAAVRTVDKQRFVVLYDISALRERETGYLLLLSISVLLVTVISALAGRWLAARIIAPVTELARRVAELQPEDEPVPLAEKFPWVEVRELAIDFDVYLKRLHDFIERERLFTGDVSHELRTPLAVINGATELLLSDENIEPATRKRVERIARAVSEMGEISAALLSLAREQGDAGGHSALCDVQSVVHEVIDRYRELFRHKAVEVVLDMRALPAVRVDRAILSMVLGNLLRNAISFTEQGRVYVRVDSDSIQVEDNGPGLDMEDPRRLFQPYVRGIDSSGAGLGLSLVWRLCERQGWQVSLDNRHGGGAIAEIRLGAATR